MRMTCRATLVALLLLEAAVTPAGAQRRRSTMGNGVISPAVVATWWTHAIDADSWQLDLLVLWRGTPGWFLRDDDGNSGFESFGGEVRTTRIRYGDVEAELRFDPRARSVTFRGHEIQLGDTNVILLDFIDSAEGPRVVGNHRVEPIMSIGHPRPELLLRQSEALLDYLRCDVPLADPKRQEHMALLCAMILGNCEIGLADPSLQKMLEAGCVPR
jgi:hypothetical protein